MPTGTRGKKRRNAYRRWRAKKGIYKCEECGKRLKHEKHHFLCNECWREKQILLQKIKVVTNNHILAENNQ